MARLPRAAEDRVLNFTQELNAIAVLWGQELPASKIASQLGMTKGSVCGLVFRARRDGDPRSRFGEVQFMELRLNDCRYPTRSLEARGEYFFCGAPKNAKSPYCDEHHGLCVSGAVYSHKKRALTYPSRSGEG